MFYILNMPYARWEIEKRMCSKWCSEGYVLAALKLKAKQWLLKNLYRNETQLVERQMTETSSKIHLKKSARSIEVLYWK